MKALVESVEQAVAAWPEITTAPHRYNGVEFNLGTTEIGHMHRHGMVDILFSKAIRQQLVAEGKAEVHHLLPDTGWISYYLRSERDVEGALWLFRLAYLNHILRLRRRDATAVAELDAQAELDALHLSAALQAIVVK